MKPYSCVNVFHCNLLHCALCSVPGRHCICDVKCSPVQLWCKVSKKSCLLRHFVLVNFSYIVSFLIIGYVVHIVYDVMIYTIHDMLHNSCLKQEQEQCKCGVGAAAFEALTRATLPSNCTSLLRQIYLFKNILVNLDKYICQFGKNIYNWAIRL